MSWNFLSPRVYEIRVAAPLSAVSEALDKHINGLPVRKGWLDFSPGLISSSYIGDGTSFIMEQRINMGRNEIWVYASGEGVEKDSHSILTITYIVGPRWVRYFLWISIAASVFIAFVTIIGLFQERINIYQITIVIQSPLTTLVVCVPFAMVPFIINFSYQNEIKKLDDEVHKALKQFRL